MEARKAAPASPSESRPVHDTATEPRALLETRSCSGQLMSHQLVSDDGWAAAPRLRAPSDPGRRARPTQTTDSRSDWTSIAHRYRAEAKYLDHAAFPRTGKLARWAGRSNLLSRPGRGAARPRHARDPNIRSRCRSGKSLAPVQRVRAPPVRHASRLQGR